MFLNSLLKENKSFVDACINLHKEGLILPDTYVIDVDQFVENARNILNEANKNNIDLYYMLKQVGHNPYLGEKLEEIGYKGAVVVDQKEADIIMKSNLHICNAGHLVQISFAYLKKIMEYGCDYMTVYSKEKIQNINDVAKSLNIKQKLLIRVIGEDDVIYPGQTAGFKLDELTDVVNFVKKLDNVEISGLTSFPCFLFNENSKTIEPQNNINTLMKAKKILEDMGISSLNINAPSATCCRSISLMSKYGIASAEPGHGLSGTTPLHAISKEIEKPCVLYLSEISHNYNGNSYVYGGGYYPRGHMKNALVVNNNKQEFCEFLTPSSENIDYYIALNKEYEVNDTVIAAFRFQIFVTRSDVCLLSGIKSNNPKIVGIYYSNGIKKI